MDIKKNIDNKRKGYSIVISVALAVFMVRLDSYIVNISLPTISRYFHVDMGEISWVIISYLLVMTGSMLIFGKLADKIGLKKIFIGGYVFFTVGSLLCGLSPSILLLNISRGIQGIGGAMMVTSAFAIISHYLPVEHTGWAFGICAFANSLGIMIGAPLGGLLTGFFSWQLIFLINIPVGVFAVIVARRALPADNVSASIKDTPFDLAGSALSFIAVSAFIFVLTMGRTMGWTSVFVLTAAGVALVALPLFVIRERSFADPILDFSIFENRDFTFANVTTLLALMLLSGGNFLMPFYLEMVKGLRPEYVGAVILIYSIVYMPIGLYSGRLSDRISPSVISSTACLIALGACLTFTFTLTLPGLMPPVLFLILLAIGYGFFFSSNNHLVMSLAPADHQGSASGIYSTVMNVGMVLGVCIFEGSFSLSLPSGLSIKHIPPVQGDDHLIGLLTIAFQHAFMVGCVICFLAFMFSLPWKRIFFSKAKKCDNG
ncbi:MAG: Riboflavin transporter RibZ [Syntrophus sp. SKADARSKE-3]|nr:Riboflavin transporter RibZ [Syntrophus sp. SKADARSKE-3]